jgi:hypothetical protein
VYHLDDANGASEGGGKSVNDASFFVIQEPQLAYQRWIKLLEERRANMDSLNVAPIKIVSRCGSAGHVKDRDGAAEGDKGKGVAQWGACGE